MARILRVEGTSIERLARRSAKIFLVGAVLALLTSLGCAGTAWDRALEQDTPQAYHHFMRQYPNSDNLGDAKERIAFHKVKRRPSLQRYREFQAEYPGSGLLEDLRPLIEGLAFDAARAGGTPASYRAFAVEFPGGAYALRAEGNAVYLDANGYAGQPDGLRAFAAEYPESNFAAEARRSVEGLATRERSRFQRVGLVVDIVPGTPEVDRLVAAFTERAMDIYKRAGIQLVVVPDIAPPNAPKVRLTIRHGESLVKASVTAGTVSRGGAVARTVVTLRDGVLRGREGGREGGRKGAQEGAQETGALIFEQAFELRLDVHKRIANASLLFASKQAKLYWDEFFVPVSSWRSSAAVRSPVELEKKVTAVDAVLGRAVVLFEDGDFHLMGLSDPEKPVVLARYDRESKLEHFEGVKIVGDEVILFGQDGLEFVSFTVTGLEATSTHSRGELGSVSAVLPTKEGLLLASSQGLLLAESDGSNAERIMRRIAHGLDAMGDSLVFTDGESVFVSTLTLLRQNRVIAQLRLGREFKPGRVRVVGTHAIVMGQGGVVVLDLSAPAKPLVVSKLPRRISGRVHDAVRVGNQVFLLGSRGVQLLDSKGTRIVEVVDVVPQQRVARTGRHLVIVGEQQLQVVDGLPFARKSRPASARR